MKRKNIIILSLIILSICAPEASAQGWLNKALKKIDNVSKKVDEGLNKLNGDSNTETTVKEPATNSNPTGADIKCSNPKLNIQFESCIRDGRLTVLTYYIINNGSDLKINYLGRSTMPSKQTNTSIYDSEGKQYKWTDLTFGDERYNGTEWLAPVILPEGIKVKCTLVLRDVSKTAKQIKRATITGWDFVLQFNNVPILTVNEILNKDKIVFKKENPAVGSQTKLDEKLAIESVSITENNTQIRILFEAPQNSTYGADAPVFQSDAGINANGQSYALLNAFGVTKHYSYASDYKLNPGKSAYVDLIFEKIPKTTEVFDINFGNLFWKSVRLVEAGALNVPRTQGVLSLNDTYNQHDNRKRMTAAERTALKINSIKNADFNIKWTNNQLSAGKTIYKGKEGKLQTVLFIEKENAVDEYLVSYNASGNVVDCIRIASIRAYGGDRGEGIIEGSIVKSAADSFSEDSESTTWTSYRITPELKFVQIK